MKKKYRLKVRRSLKHLYAELYDNEIRQIILSTSSLKLKIKQVNLKNSFEVGKSVGKIIVDKKITSIWFDRNGIKYHGCIKALADGARESGVVF